MGINFEEVIFSQTLQSFLSIHGKLSAGNLSYFSIDKNKSTENFSLIRYLRWFQILSLITVHLNTLNQK